MRLRGLDLRTLLGIGAPLLLFLAACGDDGSSSEDDSSDAADGDAGAAGEPGSVFDGPDCDLEDVSFTATAKHDELDELVVYTEPDGDELDTLPTTWAQDLEDPDYGSPVTFLITEENDRDDPDWYHVDLPVPDAGSGGGYIRAEDVDVGCTAYRITVDREAFTLTVSLEGVDIITAEVGLGRDERATEPGDYYLTQLMRNVNPDDAYGPFAYALNAFADDDDIVSEFDIEGRGYATVGIHGTDDPESLGTNVSSGCIRMENEKVTAIKENAIPLGTPVHVV